MGVRNPDQAIELFRDICIQPLDLTVTDASKAVGVTRKTLSSPLNGRSGLSPEMALRLSKVFGRAPEGWMRLQLQYDLWRTNQSVDMSHLERIQAVPLSNHS